MAEGEGDKIVYEQEDIFVHTAVPSSTFYDDIIRGRLCIIEKKHETTVDWQPMSDLTPEMGYEVHSLFSGPHEYGVVTKQQEDVETTQPKSMAKNNQPYKVTFDVEKIHSIRRSDPRLAWSYVIFILKDGSTQPALHFHDGGIKKMISALQRYVWLTRSPVNKKLYIVQKTTGAMDSKFNQFELFADNPGHVVSNFLNNTYYGTLSGFSKVTQYVLGSMGQQDLQERRPDRRENFPHHIPEDLEDADYEFLHSDEPDVLGPIIPVARGTPLQPEEWCAFIDDNGVVRDVTRLKERIFRGGIHGDIKKEAWKFILNYYKFDQTYEERIQDKNEKINLYNVMKAQWSTITPQQERRFTEFANRKHLVDKDVLRTDRKSPFYAGEDNENVKKLFNILMTYCMFNFDLGYVQGMSDLLSPILLLMEDEVDAFWCFVGLMEMEEKNFEVTQHVMKQQLENLGKLVKYLYPNFWTYLESHESGNLYFCFRWILISFKRDFGLGDLMNLWEAMWTQDFTPHFNLFVCLAILEREKDIMMKHNYGFEEILKHVNELSGNIDLSCTLSRAESICLQLKRSEELPEEIKRLVYGQCDTAPTEEENVIETDEVVNSEQLSDNLLHNAACSVNNNVRERTSDEAVVELNEGTQSVF